jgi:fructose-bisphosphate aldolase class II
MPVVNQEQYLQMLDDAKSAGFAYPAINVSSSQSLNAALEGFERAGSNGIIQVSTGGADYWSGANKKNRVQGAVAFAAFAKETAKSYGINVAIHTDHCAKDQLDGFVRPLLALSEEQVKKTGEPIFNSHMWDGSAIDLDENLEIAKDLLARSKNVGSILEIEVGAVGGEEDGVVGASGEHLYTTIEDGIKTVEALGLGENGRYMTALTFGNVHGVYKPGNVVLKPELLNEIQSAIGEKYGKNLPFDLVFHGGSGSTEKEISDAVSFGVIKMNIDTDTQYAFTRPVADHMLKNYDGVLKIDGEVGNKKTYDPRAWGKLAETSMADRVIEACKQLGSAGKA